ncbi:hypothetical protein K6L44_17285 [Gluconacetobacter entanii]|nr:hypothetical protein [Gluconacetobacter entanii]MCW4578892.1 hypothetical protein [Gluconacetobacter entanii]MCW4582291.1 hypothetical protein [Gluconacetobacter entanii]MCW4585674.1 hypothetical protein [Gluconacetobacter entanii]
METPDMADTDPTTAIPALENLIETALGKGNTAATQADIALAGNLLQTLIPVIVEKAAPNLDLSGIDAALTKILTGISDLKDAIATKPVAAAPAANATVGVPRPSVPGQPAH